jgi:DNA-directed RNA polymerase specialized sigma24 family protein
VEEGERLEIIKRACWSAASGFRLSELSLDRNEVLSYAWIQARLHSRATSPGELYNFARTTARRFCLDRVAQLDRERALPSIDHPSSEDDGQGVMGSMNTLGSKASSFITPEKASSRLEQKQQVEVLTRYVSQMPAKPRLIFLLHYLPKVMELSALRSVLFETAAKIFGQDQSTVEKRLDDATDGLGDKKTLSSKDIAAMFPPPPPSISDINTTRHRAKRILGKKLEDGPDV